MVTERYLLINRRGNIRMTSRPPVALRNGEVMIRLRVNIDPAIFTTGIPQAELMVNPTTLHQGITVRVDTNEPRYFTPEIAGRFYPPAQSMLDEMLLIGHTTIETPPRRRHDPAQDE